MMYLIALAIAGALGFLTLRLIIGHSLSFSLSLFLGTALGLGIVGQLIFYIQLLGNNFNHFLPPVLTLILLGVLIWANKAKKTSSSSKAAQKNHSLWILVLLAIPLWLEATHYPMGGWDAWSCWNLKAKFIYLGETAWKDMLSPLLWRSNTGYPLALPTINVWFWHWTGVSQDIPMFNSILLTLLTAGTLLLGLQELKISKLVSILITLAIFSSAFNNTLSISQYSDILFSLYLLCAFVCYFLFHQLKSNRLLTLMGAFIGLLSFTKNEGLAASGILVVLVLIKHQGHLKTFISAVLSCALTTLIFALFMAPHGQAFINGLLSADKPSTLERLQYILTTSLYEFVSPKWMGLWLVAGLGLGLARNKILKGPGMVVGLFMVLYMGIVLAYYQINTFFEIGWWMNFTLNRIIFALMPSIFFWMGLCLFGSKKDA